MEIINIITDSYGNLMLAGGEQKDYIVTGHGDGITYLKDLQGNPLILDHRQIKLRPDKPNKQTDMKPIPVADLAEYKDGVSVAAVEGVLTKLYEVKTGTSVIKSGPQKGQEKSWFLQGGILTDDNQNEIGITFADEKVIQPKEMWNKRIHIECHVGQKGANGLKTKLDTYQGKSEMKLWVTGAAEITYPDGKPAPRQEKAPAADKPVSAPTSGQTSGASRSTPQHQSTVADRVSSYFKVLAEVSKQYADQGEDFPELTSDALKDIATHIGMTYRGDYGAYAPPVFSIGAAAKPAASTDEAPSTEEDEPPFLPDAPNWRSAMHPTKPELGPMEKWDLGRQKKSALWAATMTDEQIAKVKNNTAQNALYEASLAMAKEFKWTPLFLTGFWLNEEKVSPDKFDRWCSKQFGVSSDEINEENAEYILRNAKSVKDQVEKMSAEETEEDDLP